MATQTATRWKRADITDDMIRTACYDKRPTWIALQEDTGAPWKVIEAALCRADDRDLIEWGINIGYCWWIGDAP